MILCVSSHSVLSCDHLSFKLFLIDIKWNMLKSCSMSLSSHHWEWLIFSPGCVLISVAP